MSTRSKLMMIEDVCLFTTISGKIEDIQSILDTIENNFDEMNDQVLLDDPRDDLESIRWKLEAFLDGLEQIYKPVYSEIRYNLGEGKNE